MEDKKLNLKLKIIFNQERQQGEKLVAVSSQPVAPEQEDKDELEEGEIRQDGAEQQQQQQQQDDVAAAASESKKRTCPHCGKEFSNGKALGGHLRVHAENNNSKPVKKPVGSSSSPEEAAEPQVCDICFKIFKSKKSLFGHMRSHPDRLWRGMRPPSHNPGIIINGPDEPGPSKPEPEPLLSAVNKLGVVKGWKVTGKRGRYADSSASASTSSSFGHRGEVAEAGELVMHLANGDSGGDDEVVVKRKKNYDEDELYFLGMLDESASNSPSPPLPNSITTTDDLPNKSLAPKMKIKGKGKAVSISTNDDNKKRRSIIRVDYRSNRADNDDDGDEKKNVVNKFKCSNCDRAFPTHQALGGHRSSHNNKATNFKTLTQIRDEYGSGLTHIGSGAENGVSGSGSGSGSGEEVVDDGILSHKCKICDQGFISIEALGSHRSCHYIPSTESSPGESSSKTGWQGGTILGLDLNVAAKLEEDEDGDGVVESTFT